MAGKLNVKKVAAVGPGFYGDGDGLSLEVNPKGGRKWVYRFYWEGKPKRMGLGSANDIGLADARRLRDDARRLVLAGVNPVVARKEARYPAAALRAKPTFGQVADDFIAAQRPGWSNNKHAAQWEMTLRVHAAPIRCIPVDEVSTAHILAVLQPLWQRVPETASRLRGRIETILDAARALGHIDADKSNPARWKGHLALLLPKRSKAAAGHYAAMPYQEVCTFVSDLRRREAMAAQLLEFTILTAARTGEAVGAKWQEIDFEGAVWTVPAARMKMGRIHRVPLCDRAMEIVRALSKTRMGEFIFPAPDGGALSNMAMSMLMRRMGRGEYTVHGFRSSFRDWAGDETTFQREVAEAALAHVVGDDAEQAYRRGDALTKRRALMQVWQEYLDDDRQDNVLPFRVGGAESECS